MQVIEVVDAGSEQVIATLPEATSSNVDAAFDAARRAFPKWSGVTGAERARVLRAIAAEIKAHHEELSRLEATMGKLLSECRWDVDDVIYCFEYYAKQAVEVLDARQGTPVALPDDDYTCELQYAATGVAACIVPWNYPLLMATWKLAPCLAAGCTCVIKPSELSPLSLLLLAKITQAAGLPDGVLNVLVGAGRVGAMLAAHPGADKVAFTGSEATGARVMAAASATIKNVSLELGGKSAVVVFDDADIDKAVEWVMFGVFWTNGQICSSTSRLLIQRGLAPAFLARLKQCAEAIPLVAPLDPQHAEATGALGPLVCKRALEKVERLVREALADGARLLTGGRRPPGRAKGFFYEPTVLEVKPSRHEIWTTEVFGPVLAVAPFDTEAEAINLANATNYGLAAAVITSDDARAKRVARALQAGIVWVNCSQPCFADAPWGGYKRSGIGRELGEHGLFNFLETKQVTTYVSPKPLGWYQLPPPRSRL